MSAGIRPYVSASIALVGASVIAVTPITAPPAPVPAAHTAVRLSAIPSPLQLYPQVIGTALGNSGKLRDEYFADPFPIVRAILRNEGSAFDDAFTALQFGFFDEFFTAVADVFVQPFTNTGAALAHLDALFHQPMAIPGFFLIAISPVLSGIAATGHAIGDVFEAIATFDVVGLVNAVINIPARIIDGVLNGVPGTSFGVLENLPGLLTPSDTPGDSVNVLPPGPISVGIGLDQDMGAAILPRTSVFPVAVPDPDAATVTLTTALPSDDVGVSDESDSPEEADAPAPDPSNEESEKSAEPAPVKQRHARATESDDGVSPRSAARRDHDAAADAGSRRQVSRDAAA